MDHRHTFTGKQQKTKLLEKQIFGESSHELAILDFGIINLIKQISKAIPINEHYI